MNTTIIFQIQSFLIILLMLYGILKARNRLKHSKIMISAMVWDVLLILQIEFSRQAINRAAKSLGSPDPMLWVHLFFALGSVIFYIFMFRTGRKILKGNNDLITKHKLLGRITFSFRFLTLVTSFFIPHY